MSYLFGIHSPAMLALSALLFLLHVLVMMRAITRGGRTPASRVAWVAVIALLPALGLLAYAMLGETSIGRRRMQRLRAALDSMPLPAAGDAAVNAIRDGEAARELAPAIVSLSTLAASINGLPPTRGNRIRLLGDPDASPGQPMRDSDAAITHLVADIDQAREHVHISFYIWLDDHNGGRVADAVVAAARRGVHCRVMADALGSHAFIHSPRWRQLAAAGVQLVADLNDIPRLGHLAIGRLDLRNHRKIAVIDNRIGYVGSQNCADPQFRVKPEFAPWIDMLLRCEGPLVRQAQYLFLSSWIATTGEALQALPNAQPAPERFPDDTIAQLFGTGPTGSDQDNAMSDMFVASIYAARHDLLITTPYFVPDEAIINALCAAPRRGVNTRVIFPARNDSLLVGSTCRSHYLALLENGVHVHEYPLGLLHSKSLSADGELVLVGSANMDRRSLQLNFEDNLLSVDAALFDAVRRRQLSYLSVSRPVAIETVRAWPFHVRLWNDAIGMMAPLL